jgi:hypothetical protein
VTAGEVFLETGGNPEGCSSLRGAVVIQFAPLLRHDDGARGFHPEPMIPNEDSSLHLFVAAHLRFFHGPEPG